MVAPTPLPDLPQRHLLTALLELNADLPAVAARTSTPLDDLTRWAHTAEVHAWLEAHHHFACLAREHRELARATRTLDHLESLHTTTENPVQKRLILTAILRASTAILTNARRVARPASSASQIEGVGGWVPATPELENPHSRSASKPLPEGGVGVGSLDSPTPKPGGSSQTSSHNSFSNALFDPVAGAGSSDSPTQQPLVPAALPHHPSAPADPQAPLPTRTPRPHLHLPSTLQSPPTPHFNPFPTSHISRSRPRSPAHLLAAAGLPGP